jgi:hypothetical protein
MQPGGGVLINLIHKWTDLRLKWAMESWDSNLSHKNGFKNERKKLIQTKM